jgi:uncharacterized membrane protein
MKRNLIIEIISSLLILLFLYTGANKFFSFQHFIDQMNNQVFPNSWTRYIIWSLPTIEIAIAVALIFDKTKRIALWGSLILMLLFTIYTALVLFRVFDRVPCSCGGVIEHLTWVQHFFFNLFFVAISIIGILLWKKQVKETESSILQKTVFT